MFTSKVATEASASMINQSLALISIADLVLGAVCCRSTEPPDHVRLVVGLGVVSDMPAKGQSQKKREDNEELLEHSINIIKVEHDEPNCRNSLQLSNTAFLHIHRGLFNRC
jgi:hypothetical protein